MNYYIQTYEEYLQNGGNTQEGLFFIIEYNPEYYDLPEQKYSLMRNEILQHPQDFKERLNNGVYRVWISTPIDLEW